ncbi:DMT family transporter [Sphingosinicella sp.]|uniref:DMT family transporter n=1 Tax=Sphingosinicella sp. TaxID=1917971 RepID=UPI004037F592
MTDAASSHSGRSPLFGIGLRLGATIAFALMAALIKLAADHGVNAPELVFYRSLFALPPLMVWIAASRNPGRWRTQRPIAHLTRGAIGLTSMFLSFGALTLLPLAEAVTLSFIAPLFAVALSALILSEPVGRHRWAAVAIGLLGVLVVMRPAGTGLSPLGLGLAVAGAFSVAAAMITIRQIGRTESTQSIVLWFTLICTAAGAATMPVFGQLHDGTTWALLVAMGTFGGVGQLLMTASLRAAPVGAVVPFDYAHLIWAALLGWLIWDTRPRATTWAGAAIIIASGLYTLYREHKLGREKPPSPEPL